MQSKLICLTRYLFWYNRALLRSDINGSAEYSGANIPSDFRCNKSWLLEAINQYRISHQVEHQYDIWWRWKLETNRNVVFLIENIYILRNQLLTCLYYKHKISLDCRLKLNRVAAFYKPISVSNFVSDHIMK